MSIAEAESKLSAGYGDGSSCPREALAKLQHVWKMLSSSKPKRQSAAAGRRKSPAPDAIDPLDIIRQFSPAAVN